jgi:hypothetical protein
VNVTFRPLPRWPYPEQRPRPSTYQATYSKTLDQLEREIEALHGSEVIIGVVTSPDSIRLDGRMRADARVNHPGVEVSFGVPQRGRLVFHTDRHKGYVNSWQDNLRAITLGLEALRAVDRYGITSTAEQYAGFAQLTTSAPNPERGRQLVDRHGGLRPALRATHPDHGGDSRDFADVQAFRQLSGAPL